MLEMLQHPFFQNALIAGTLVAVICSFLGVYVVLKRIVFVGITLAQIASAGVALALLLRLNPLLLALAFSLSGVAFFSQVPSRRKVPMEGVIGFSYVLAAAMSVIFIAKNPVGEARALRVLFGNILSVPTEELLILTLVFAIMGLVHFLFYKEFLFVSFDFETAQAHGINAKFWDFLLYLTLGVAVAFAIKSTGILLTFALLVVPAMTARLLAERMGPMFAFAVLFGSLSVPVGLYLAFRFDLPTGSTIAATSTAFLLLVGLGKFLAQAVRFKPAAALLGLALFLYPAIVAAEDQKVEALEKEVEGLKTSLQELQETVRSQQELIQAERRRQGLPPHLALIPEVRVEGNLIGNYTFQNRKKFQGPLEEEVPDEDFFIRRNRFNFREVELGLRAAVDPFASFEAILSAEQIFGGELELELEEGILTLLQLPLGAQVKVGRFRTSFGEFNDSDPEEFPEVDPPNVITTFFGRDGDGWIDTGLSLNVPFSLGDVPFLVWGGIFNGDNETAFHGGKGGLVRKPTYVGRLEAFFEVGPSTGLEMGVAGATGHTLDEDGVPRLRSSLLNFHFEFDYRHPVLSLYKGFNFLTEFFYSFRERRFEREVEENGNGIEIIDREFVRRFGLYTLGELQLSREWFLGARFDYAQLPEKEEGRKSLRAETAGSVILTYKPSRFLTLRAQYKHTERNFAPDSDEVFLQALFIIGFERPGPF